MRAVTVTGRFVDEFRRPLEGMIRFIPSQVWIDVDGVTYPTMAPEVQLEDGAFEVQLTRTDTAKYPWHYAVDCPVGVWSIWITDDGPLYLSKLLPRRDFTR